MQTVGQQLIIAAIPILPALVFFVLALLGRLLRENAQYVAILGVTVSLVFSVFALLYVAGVIPGGGSPIEFSVNWIDLGAGGSFSMGVYIDGLAAVMLVVVSFVSLMIQLYSGAFMEGDERFGRLLGHLAGGPVRVYRGLAVHDGGDPRVRRRRRQERAVPAARVASRRHGG